MRPAAGHPGRATACVLAASVLWGTTGTAATFAPAVGPLAIGAVAMGLGGLLQALTAAAPMARERAALRVHWRLVLLGGAAVAVFPLAFYASMRLAGVAVGTVVSIGSAPLASALAERVIDRRRLTARWMAAPPSAWPASWRCAWARPPRHIAATRARGRPWPAWPWALPRGRRTRSTHGPRTASSGAGSPPARPWARSSGSAGCCSCPCCWPPGRRWRLPGTAQRSGVYLALVPMFTGYLLFGWALARVSASIATTLSLLEPAVAAILAVTVAGERLPSAGWAGLALIAACLIVLTASGRAVLPFLYFITSSHCGRLFDGRHIITRLSRYGREVGSARL